MSNSTRSEREASSDTPIARAVVPILMAVGAITLAIAMAQGGPPAPAADAGPLAADTPASAYSEDHRRVEEAPGEPEPQPPTF